MEFLIPTLSAVSCLKSNQIKFISISHLNQHELTKVRYKHRQNKSGQQTSKQPFSSHKLSMKKELGSESETKGRDKISTLCC